jgi:hypothetical protein
MLTRQVPSKGLIALMGVVGYNLQKRKAKAADDRLFGGFLLTRIATMVGEYDPYCCQMRDISFTDEPFAAGFSHSPCH